MMKNTEEEDAIISTKKQQLMHAPNAENSVVLDQPRGVALSEATIAYKLRKRKKSRKKKKLESGVQNVACKSQRDFLVQEEVVEPMEAGTVLVSDNQPVWSGVALSEAMEEYSEGEKSQKNMRKRKRRKKLESSVQKGVDETIKGTEKMEPTEAGTVQSLKLRSYGHRQFSTDSAAFAYQSCSAQLCVCHIRVSSKQSITDPPRSIGDPVSAKEQAEIILEGFPTKYESLYTLQRLVMMVIPILMARDVVEKVEAEVMVCSVKCVFQQDIQPLSVITGLIKPFTFVQNPYPNNGWDSGPMQWNFGQPQRNESSSSQQWLPGQSQWRGTQAARPAFPPLNPPPLPNTMPPVQSLQSLYHM
uniref:CM0545.280.nc protein n=1 Tax=Lotus japonicus TaxID=34305 RepID=B0BLB3_LOTJA|nr:CM0545.280.nc [Lotus japonicus]